MCDLQLSLILQTHAHAIKNLSELYVMQLPQVILPKALALKTKALVRVLWEELLVLSRFHS